MNFFGIGLPEMLVILAIALLVFGPKKLPEIGRSLGKALRGFQDASREFESEIKREIDRPPATPAEATVEPPVLDSAPTEAVTVEKQTETQV